MIKPKKNVLLSNYTTFKIGGPAKHFLVVKNGKDLIQAIKMAKGFHLPFLIIGSGSNLLVSDKGYRGFIIRLENNIHSVKGNKIYSQAGAMLSNIVFLATNNSLKNLEWAAGIPGTVGGAVYGNIAAFGTSMANILKEVRVLDTKSLKIKNLSVKQCKFNNKESIFKKNKNLIILSAVLELKRGDSEEIKSEVKRFLTYRKNNHPLSLPSAGCVFKNYDKKIKNKELLKKYPELIEFNKGTRIPTSYLIDKAGLKGKIIGRAQISEKHANFIVNLGGAKTADVLKLIKLIKKEVKNKFGIILKEEIQCIK